MTFEDTPIFRDVVARRALRERAASTGGRHRWVDEPPTGPIRMEVPVARHHDHDGDGVADQADPDFPATPADWAPEDTYDFPDPGWRPESDFTGEWVDELVEHGTVDGETA